MLKLGEFNLEFAFAGAGALTEDIQDERCAIQDFALEDPFHSRDPTRYVIPTSWPLASRADRAEVSARGIHSSRKRTPGSAPGSFRFLRTP